METDHSYEIYIAGVSTQIPDFLEVFPRIWYLPLDKIVFSLIFTFLVNAELSQQEQK